MLIFIAKKLEEICEEVVFLGGCTTALFITDPGSSDVRPTIDVDCIVDVISPSEYYKLEKRLRQKGFSQSLKDGIICRWSIGEMILDVMPTNEQILGFSNRWYQEAISNAVSIRLDQKNTIKIVTAPYFLATKLEAFKGRGKKDFLGSHDLEDIILVLDGRPEIVTDVLKCSTHLKEYLKKEFSGMIQNRAFNDALPGHLNYSTLSEERLSIVLERIKAIIGSHVN